MIFIKNPDNFFTGSAKSFSRVVLTCHRLVSHDKNQGEIRNKATLEKISQDLPAFRIPFHFAAHFSVYKLAKMIMIMNLYSAFSIFIYSNALYKPVIYGQRPDHNTGNYVPYSLR